jgi:hypothetical protein
LKRIAILIVAAMIGLVALSACSLSDDGYSDPAFRTLRYEGGDFGGSKFKECLSEGEKLASNDRYYAYPTTQRQDKWDSANFGQGAKSADYADMVLTDKSGIGVNLKVTVPFVLNTSCEEVEANGKTYPGGAIQAFHEIFGKTRNGYFDPKTDGNNSYGEGWLWLMDTYISNCVVQTLTPKVRAQDAETLWLDDAKRTELTTGLKDLVQKCVNDSMETDLQFYTIGNATVDKITPDEQFVALYRDRQEAKTRAETADLNKAAQIAEAQAKAAVAKEEAKVKLAEIEGYGGFENYKCIYLADHGLNCAQSVYYVGGSK